MTLAGHMHVDPQGQVMGLPMSPPGGLTLKPWQGPHKVILRQLQSSVSFRYLPGSFYSRGRSCRQQCGQEGEDKECCPHTLSLGAEGTHQGSPRERRLHGQLRLQCPKQKAQLQLPQNKDKSHWSAEGLNQEQKTGF